MGYRYYEAVNEYTGKKYQICFTKIPYWRCNKREGSKKYEPGHQHDWERGETVTTLVKSSTKIIDEFTTRKIKTYESTVLKRKSQKVKCIKEDCNGTIEFIGYSIWVEDVTKVKVKGMFTTGTVTVEKMKFYKTVAERKTELNRLLEYYQYNKQSAEN